MTTTMKHFDAIMIGTGQADTLKRHRFIDLVGGADRVMGEERTLALWSEMPLTIAALLAFGSVGDRT